MLWPLLLLLIIQAAIMAAMVLFGGVSRKLKNNEIHIVKIGAVDIREIPHADLMKMVACVFQDPKLFKYTLLENIPAGRPSATREEVLQAAHLAQCDDILEKFPDASISP